MLAIKMEDTKFIAINHQVFIQKVINQEVIHQYLTNQELTNQGLTNQELINQEVAKMQAFNVHQVVYLILVTNILVTIN